MKFIPLYILAGGRSRRFGTDKARAELNGQPLIQRIARAAQPVTASTTVVADVPDKYADLGLRTIADREPDLGPVGGLSTALTDLQTHGHESWLLLSSCDLVQLPPDWPASLLRHATDTPTAAACAVAYKNQRWEPLLALYHLSLRPRIDRYIDQGGRSMWRLLEQIGAVSIALPAGMTQLTQINTPQDHQLAARPASQRPPLTTGRGFHDTRPE